MSSNPHVSANPLVDFAARLHQGPTAFAAWCGSKDPSVLETLLSEGFDCAILDWQHGLHDHASIVAGITAAFAAGKASLVRIGVGDFSDAARFLDWGAAGIIAPMINSVADAKAFVDVLKYPPRGSRSWGPVRAMGMSGLDPNTYLTTAHQHTLAIAMIETKTAMAALDNILDVEGLDGVLVGPSDLSITLNDGAFVDASNAKVDAALTRIAEAARKRGKLACAFCMDGPRAAELSARGFHLLSVATDGILLRKAGREELAKARGKA